MFIQVKLLEGYSKPLYYKVPTNLVVSKNMLVKVPLKKKFVPAIVINQFPTLPSQGFIIREIEGVEPFPNDNNYHEFIDVLSSIYFISRIHFYQRVRQFLKLKTEPLTEIPKTKEPSIINLTTEQQTVVDFMIPLIHKPTYNPTLLHGVTSSGKTEIYVKLLLETINTKKSAILLLPEVSLSIQFQHIIQKKMPSGTPIFGFHSATQVSEKKQLWQRLLNNFPTIIIGVHLPILLPISNLGLIIIDEEHEINFQEKKHPRLNSKELAILRASLNKIPILLGSATPSINSLFNVKNKGWNFFQLKKRFAGEFPKIQVSLLSKKERRKNFWITKDLELAIQETLNKKEQVLIFLNRRGYSLFLLCKPCGFIFECPNCSVTLTLHKTDIEIIKCHYCTYQASIPSKCPKCSTPETNFLKKGIGTQQVVNILQNMFPTARIKRSDLDTLKKREWLETIRSCESGEVDILVGTQTITKGYHFPKMTLVGALWADMGLHFPMYNAGEVTLQQLLQVSGRAGRESSNSRVIFQVMHQHKLFNFLNEQDYLQFYKHEIEYRTIVGYPPTLRLICIEIKNINPVTIEKDSELMYQLLEKYNIEKNLEITILGPVKPVIFKIQKTEFRHIYLKAKSYATISMLLNSITSHTFSSSLFIIPS